MKRVIILSLSATTLLCLSAGLLASYIYFSQPRRSGATEVKIAQGDSLTVIVRKLREQKVIANETLFSLWARLTGAEKKIHWGLYRFEASLSPRDVLDRLVAGKVVLESVTIPEGLTIKEIADLLDKMGISDKEKFLAATEDTELLKTVGVEEKGLEGYLFPSTYHFAPATPEKEIITTMVEQFRKASQPILAAAEGDLTAHELLTLASIIEKETGVESERQLVAGVFHNRLRRRMPLQSDPTVIYGLKDFDGNLRRKDLRDPNPYNTYMIPALPPGPICNPGLASIKAAVEPAEVSYLYFVSKNDGSHHFSSSLSEHVRQVKRYQQSGVSAAVAQRSDSKRR